MSRMIHKLWKIPRSGFHYRIRWYQDGRTGQDIRLCMETPDGLRNEFPKTREEADTVWENFKNMAELRFNRENTQR